MHPSRWRVGMADANKAQQLAEKIGCRVDTVLRLSGLSEEEIEFLHKVQELREGKETHD